MQELNRFQLLEGQRAVITAVGFLSGEQFALEYLATEDCENESWVPYSPCGAQILVDEYYNPVVVATPGRYRVVGDNVSVDAKVYVQQTGGKA